MKWIVPILLLYLSSCANEHSEIGKYVYRDCFSTIHVDKECTLKLYDNPKTEMERKANVFGVVFVDTCYLMGDGYDKFCPKCVDDSTYHHLASIMAQNKENQRKAEERLERIDEARTWIYNKLYPMYDLPDYDSFIEDMSDPKKRKRLYETALKDGLNVGDSFEEFSELIGF